MLAPNDVLTSLWSKDSLAKCKVGIADAVIYDETGPARWYVTGKEGEITKKKTLDFNSVSSRWQKISQHQESKVMSIVRQKGNIT